MKLSSLFHRRAPQNFAALTTVFLLALPALLRAATPSVTGTLNTIDIDDTQTSAVFSGATINEGDTNILTVHVDFSPTNWGNVYPLPAGMVQSGTNYLINATNGATATTVLHLLTFTPINNLITVPNSSNVVFHVYITDASTNSNTSVLKTTTLHIFATNDAPTLTASGITNINDTQLSAKPFLNATIADVDDSGSQPQNVTVIMNETNTGYLTVGATGFSSNNFVYTFTGTPAQATTAVRGLVFVPVQNFLPVGQVATNTFTILDTDGYVTRTNNSVQVRTTSINDAPQLTGVTATHFTVQTGQSVPPFSVLTFFDADQNLTLTNNAGENLSWTVTLSGPSPLGNLELNGINVGTAYSGSGDPAVDTANLRQLVYRAPTLAISGTNTLKLAITATDDHSSTVSNSVYVDLYSVISPPGLSGTQTGQSVNDNTTVALFSKVNIQSFNGNTITVRLSLAGGATNDAQGLLINLSGFTRITNAAAPSVYQFGGSSEGATAAMHGLLFQPTPNRINGSATDTATWGITLVDGPITNATDTTTTVTIFPVNDVPTIVGISPLVTIQDNETLTPFSTVLVTDADEFGRQPVTATITLDVAAKGAFSTNSLLASGFTNTGSGYVFTGSASNLTVAIRKLIFVPTPNRVPVGLTEITTFNINLNDNHGGIVANNGTSVRVASVSGLPVINLPSPQPVSIPLGTNIYPFQQVSVSDSTALKVSVRINDTTQGAFTTNSVNASGFTNRGNGIYYFSGSASNATTALGQLDFAPGVTLPLGAVINFTISVTNALPNFVSANHAMVLRTVQNSFIVTKLTDYDPADGSVSVSLKNGTLRKAIADAKNNDHITFDIRSALAGQPDYPAVIRLVAPLVINNNLTFDGPGAERLTISGDTDGNGTADVQLFTVNAHLTMNRLAFTKGYASFAGGAFEVTDLGTLKLSYCSVTDCIADVWGGGIDVDHGSLVVEHCLIAGNSTSSALGQGGGGVSLYTDLACSIVNTTFATNRQNAVGGLGGGAIYAETSDAGTEFDVHVLSCTFHDNRDFAGHGSSIRPNVFNTFVQLQNTIVADGRGKNIEMDQSGAVISFGGNISDDATASTFSSGGAATNTFIFHAPIDLVSINATNILNALTNNGGPTLTFALTASSPALGYAASNNPVAAFYATLGTDQRGYFRDHSPDIGAFERNASQRLIIQEIRFNPVPPNTNDEFIEFYVPRDSSSLNVAGCQVLVDGVLRHTFTSQSLQPGEALVLFSSAAVSNGVPSGVYRQIAAGNLGMDNAGGVITLLNSSNQILFEADYVGAFTSTDPNDYGYLAANYQSLVLSPAFQGVFLPYQRVVAKEGGSNTNGLANPGYDATGKPLAIGNAPPFAYADLAATDAHTILPALTVLNNDVDSDITDAIRVVGVGTNGNPGVTGATNFSLLGARLIINGSPTNGFSISYDPTASALLTSLPQGSNVVDTFQYTILDSSNSVDHLRGSTSLEITQNLAKATATVTVNVVGVNAAPTPQTDDATTRTNLTTPEDVVLDFTTATNILWNDTDPNSDDNSTTLNIVSLSATNGYSSNTVSVVSALGATVTLDLRFDRNETHITYDPRGSAILNSLGLGQTTNDTFYYSVKDRYNVVGTAAIRILVTGVNDGPTANPASFATDEDTAVTVSSAWLLGNDTDPDNATVLQISAVTPFSSLGASVTIVGTNIVYDPTVSTNLNALAHKETATDTFTYTAMDDHGLTSNAVVTVTVAGVNDRPITQADFYAINEDSLFTTNAPGALLNDREPDINGLTPDDSFRVIPFTNYITAGGASVTMNANGSFSFDPRIVFDWVKAGQTTNDPFDYVVMDHSLSIANNDLFAVTASSSNNILPVLANDVVLSQADGAFTITSVTTPTNGGTVSISASNTIIYTPIAGFIGTETFTYAVADGLGGSDTATVTVVSTASTLYGNADAFTVAKGTTNALDVLANDTILPATGAAISVTSLGTPSLGGTVSLNGVGPNNLVNYTPNPAQPCPFVETFTCIITAGGLSSTNVVLVTVLDRSNLLPANNDNFTVIANSGNQSLDVLANDLILPGPNTNLTITSFTSNSVLGTVSLNAAHTRIVYKPSNTVTNHQEPIITYTVSDNAGGTATANVSIKVVPSGFIANDDTFVVVKNSTNTLPVMVNDVILPNLGQTLFISGIGIGTNAPNHGGTVTINGAGTGLVYLPLANYTGGEDFTYEISDGSPARALGHVHMVVLDNSPATSNPDTYRVQRDSAGNSLLVLKNDYPLPRIPGALTIIGLETNGIHGAVVLNNAAANNWLSYTPNLGFIGRDSFGYEFTDTLGNKGTNVVAVTVGALYPQNDLFSVLSDSVTNTLCVLTNDLVYPDSTSTRLVYQLGAPDQGGSVTTNAGATTVLYTPAPGFVGVEHFTYALKDDSTNLFTATATIAVMQRGSDRTTNTVTMKVIGVNDVPTIAGAQGGFQITDKQTVQPFTNIVIGDLDEHGLQTNLVTVSLDNSVKGVLSNLGGFTPTTPGVYTMLGTPPAITTSLKALVFVPTENRIIVPNSEMTTFTIVADDGYVVAAVSNSVTTVTVASVNDAPVVAGTQGGYQINDKQTLSPFTNASITEVDNSTLQSLVVQVSLDTAAKGTLQNLGGFTNAGNGVYTMTGVASNITASLKTLVFVPVNNRIIVPTSEITTLTISVNDGFTVGPVIDSLTTINVTATNDAPVITGTQGGYQITDKQTLSPFTNASITEVDNSTLQSLVVQVSLDTAAKGSLQNLGGFTNAGNGVYTMTGVASNITASLKTLVFVPVNNRIIVPTSEITTLMISVNDGFTANLVTNLTTTINVTATNDAPTIVGTGIYSITDKQTLMPFTNLVIGDVDNLAAVPSQPQILTVRLVMDNVDKGSLQTLGGFVQLSNGVYQVVGLASNITTMIQGMLFVPTPNHIPVPSTAAVHFTFSANDGFVAVPTTNMTTVNVTAVNDTPVIAGTVAGQTVYNRGSIKPFSGVLITELDNDRLQALRVTVTLDSASKGILTVLGGFTDLGGGVYSIGSSNGSVTAAIATTALRGLVFTPTTAGRVAPGTNETTRFTIRVDDFFAPTVVDSNTTVVAIHPLSMKVTANDRTVSSQYGWSVAATRDLTVVGAPHDSLSVNSAGSVYLLARSLDGSNTWTQIKKLQPSDGHNGDEFGTAVAISGDLVAVGARFTADRGNNSGSIYIYSRNQGGADQWGFVKKITAADGLLGDQLGTAVALSGDKLVAGSPFVDGSTGADFGAVYVFVQNQGGSNQWGQVKKIMPADGKTSDRFGSAVSLSVDKLVAGAPLVDGTNGVDYGAAYVFLQNQGGSNQWGQVAKLMASDGKASDKFGTAVSSSTDRVVIGAPLVDGTNGVDYGAAYLFTQNQGGSNQWGQVTKLMASDGKAANRFGSAVAINADSIIVGSPGVIGLSGSDYGAAYVFNQNQGGTNQWGQLDILSPASLSPGDNFGAAVALARNTVVIGAYNCQDTGGVRYGAAFMFRLKYNNGPLVLNPLADQLVAPSSPLAFVVPATTFTDPDVNETLTISVGTSPVPPVWLNFDVVSNAFSGTPNAIGSYPVAVVATDSDGFSATNQFSINVVAVVNTFSSLSMSAPGGGPTPMITVTLSGASGVGYKLQRTPSLTGNVVWTDVATSTADGSGTITFYDPVSPTGSMFYRAVAQ